MMRSIIKVILLAVPALILSKQIMAVSPDSLIEAGNKYYEKELYNDAINMYEKVLEQDLASATLYYNLGNAYFKTNDLASAILNYEKAKKLNPKNEDLLFNLKIANSRITDKIEPVPQLFFKKWWDAIYNSFSADTWSFIAIAFLYLFLAFAVIYFLSHRKVLKVFAFWTGLLFLLLTISGFLIASEKYQHTKENNEAIVFSPTITVKSSPSDNSVDLFVLHEGSKVQLLDKVDNWHEIRIANGSVGWLPGSAIKKI